MELRVRRPRLPLAGVVSAIVAALLLMAFGSATTLGATTYAAKCDAVNLRTGASTSYAILTSVKTGTLVTVAATVAGGSYGTSCSGTYRTSSTWYRISAINGRTTAALYGRTYVYGAALLFKPIVAATAAPTPTPAPSAPAATAAPSATSGPSSAPTVSPSVAPTASPTTSPSSSPSAEPTASPSVTPSPTPIATQPPPPPGPTVLPQSVTWYGRGWGHGVGLSQYGAYGRALVGQSASTILVHYFRNTTISAFTNPTIRVLVLSSFVPSSTAPLRIYGRGGAWTIDGIAGSFPLDAQLRMTRNTADATGYHVLVLASNGSTLYNGAAPGTSFRIRPASGYSVLQLYSKPVANDRFRGVLRVQGRTDGTIDVVNELPLETYLRGVVPSEISSAWPTETLKAQAIAARSYAAYHLRTGTSYFDVYDDTRSQVYQGQLREKTTTDSAIVATAGQVVMYAGEVANAMFHSAGGGATENNENVFTSSTGAITAGTYAYLRGSSDRATDGSAYDKLSPYATWHTATYSLAQVRAFFAADSRTNVGTVVAVDLRNRGVSGRLISVTLIGADGTTRTVSGAVFVSVFNAQSPAADPPMWDTLFDLAPIP